MELVLQIETLEVNNQNKMNRHNLRKKLKGVSIEDRYPIIEEYLESVDEIERQRYREFFPDSIQALQKHQSVTRAETELSPKYPELNGNSYYLIHQVACVEAKQPLRTPLDELKKRNIQRKQTRLKSKRIERKTGILADKTPTKVARKKAPREHKQY